METPPSRIAVAWAGMHPLSSVKFRVQCELPAWFGNSYAKKLAEAMLLTGETGAPSRGDTKPTGQPDSAQASQGLCARVCVHTHTHTEDELTIQNQSTRVVRHSQQQAEPPKDF